jgi:hypothetical protein
VLPVAQRGVDEMAHGGAGGHTDNGRPSSSSSLSIAGVTLCSMVCLSRGSQSKRQPLDVSLLVLSDMHSCMA